MPLTLLVEPFCQHAPVSMLQYGCFVCMLPSLDKYIIRYEIIKQILNPLFTIPCVLKIIECHNFFIIDCSSLHAPIFMPLTLPVTPFRRHAPVSMLQYPYSSLHATILRQIYYPLIDNKTNNYSPFHHLAQIEKNQMLSKIFFK